MAIEIKPRIKIKVRSFNGFREALEEEYSIYLSCRDKILENICGRDILAQFTIDNIGDFSGKSNNEIAEEFYLFQGEQARIEFEKIKESILCDARKY